jgi:hypothetical protein
MFADFIAPFLSRLGLAAGEGHMPLAVNARLVVFPQPRRFVIPKEAA